MMSDVVDDMAWHDMTWHQKVRMKLTPQRQLAEMRLE